MCAVARRVRERFGASAILRRAGAYGLLRAPPPPPALAPRAASAARHSTPSAPTARAALARASGSELCDPCAATVGVAFMVPCAMLFALLFTLGVFLCFFCRQFISG